MSSSRVLAADEPPEKSPVVNQDAADTVVHDEHDPMPLFKYTRLATNGRTPSTWVTSCLGKVQLEPDPDDAARMEFLRTQGSTSFVTVLGRQDGSVTVVHPRTGRPLLEEPLWIAGDRRYPVRSVCMDASGTFLAAMDTAAMCCIWELKYNVITTTGTANTTPTNQPNPGNYFSNLFGGALAATPSFDADQSNPSSSRTTELQIASNPPASRITYPSSFGEPSCMALDPAYKRKREKSILVGFCDGRLVYTKRGFFQRRSDAVLFQGTNAIQAVEWRGALVAWADDSGIKLLDMESLTRIAHIDRPKGARPSLYPTVSSLPPTLLFEESNSLLVAWGDCLMALLIHETQVSKVESEATTPTAANLSQQQQQQQQQVIVKRRTVECTMAWELDCVACGVVPMDREYVAVLGLVPPLTSPSTQDPPESLDLEELERNDIEVQVISRSDGAIAYCDALPLLEGTDENGKPPPIQDSASDFMLLSTFCVPRMEDAIELEEEGGESDVADDFDLQASFFGSAHKANKPTFQDSHLKWSMKSVSLEEEPTQNTTMQDDSSVDSEDYGFIFRSLEDDNSNIAASDVVAHMTPPVLMVVFRSDVVVAQVRDIDDIVERALSEHKGALALKRALRHRRRLRRYRVRDLVNEYLSGLLRLHRNKEEEPNEDSLVRKDHKLSLRRMKIAAESMPALIGGDEVMWEKWVKEFERIPGGLFVVREHIPVRDPRMPTELYGRVLNQMFAEIKTMATSSTDSTPVELILQAEEQYLNALVAWGPTQILREFIKLYKYEAAPKETALSLSRAESSLRRRYTQTSADYLRFPVRSVAAEPNDPTLQFSGDVGGENDALFDVTSLLKTLESFLPPSLSGAEDEESTESSSTKLGVIGRVALDAYARLNMMEGKYDIALRSFLTIGALHAPMPLSELEDLAVGAVNSSDLDFGEVRKDKALPCYAHVLAMIEYRHLQEYLLDKDFIADAKDDESYNPLVALLQLVGLDLMEHFLIEHCVAPREDAVQSPNSLLQRPFFQNEPSKEYSGEVHETLPIDVVAKHLKGSPKILHWYLHLVLKRKPELYIKFPNTAYPPTAITDLHRRHLDLYVKFAGVEKNSVLALAGTESYKVDTKTTPLLSFLKAALPLGGIRPMEAKRKLESARSAKADSAANGGFSSTFALELAYVTEHHGKNSKEEAQQIVDLYLRGADSLTLAVSYAQRNREYSSLLWDFLIDYCLSLDKERGSGEMQVDGKYFGSLLESAALSGADLAHLVTQIPPGMAVEGLRPRLVAAVADYRLKQTMHAAASKVSEQEKVGLIRELSHRSRRGVRYVVPRKKERQSIRISEGNGSKRVANPAGPKTTRESLTNRVRHERRNHYTLSFSLPIR